ncbi:MAG TPA: hypothetical protein DGT23_33970 [Micromonosporaceae bacterium]|nr:hypothetical protein [Micromonosporaceae bacterium]
MFARISIFISVLLAATLIAVQPASAVPSDASLAQHWAPVHYQDTDSSDYDADYLSAVDFDGEWDAKNNWEHQDDNLSRMIGTVYYSVVETSTHWHLVYSFYHPRDWEDFPDPFSQFTHENDMEGVLLVVRKDGSEFGKFEAMVTVAHTDFYSYIPPGSPYTSGRENIDGTIVMQSYGGVSRPTTFQEAKGHGIYRWNGSDPGDAVVYYPTGTGEVPSNGNDRFVGYRLVNTFATSGLWAHRNDSLTFAGWGTFRGDNGKDNAANTAWGWDDGNDGSDLQRGLLATDPARLVSIYFGNEGTFSLGYLRNGYV